MEHLRPLTMDELNKTALEHFIYQPVSRDMIVYLARAASSVIACDNTPTSVYSSDDSSSQDPNLPPTPPRSPTQKYDDMPTLEEFITRLVVDSNVQVATLMSTLVYLGRLKSKLQPMARGLRCTTHRIFLASLILAAKYLNDSSPKNKHWARYTYTDTEAYRWGFSRTEVNLMERQLLLLLDWDLRIHEQDLYRELDDFLEPLRGSIMERQARKLRQYEERLREKAAYEAARYPSPPSSRENSRDRANAPAHSRSNSSGSTPGLTFSSAASISSSLDSRAGTPEYEEPTNSYDVPQGEIFSSPVEIILDDVDIDMPKAVHDPHAKQVLPYEITEEQYHELHSQKRHKRGVLGRLLGSAVQMR